MKKKHLGQRILLSLLLSGCVSSYASADDGTYTYEYNTYTVSDGTGTFTYTDANGTTHTYTYNTKMAVSGTDTYDIKTTYASDVAEGGGTNIAYIDEDTKTLPSATWTTASGKEVSIPITVYYGDSTGYIDNTDNAYIDSIKGNNISADFIDDNRGSNYGGAIYNYANTGNSKIGTITGNFVGNNENSSGLEYGGAIYNGAKGANSAATIDSITGNFIGNYVVSTDSTSSWGGAIYNRADGADSKAIIGDITGDFIGNYASTAQHAEGGAIQNEAYGSNSAATIDSVTGNFIGNYVSSTNSFSYGGAIVNISSKDSSGTNMKAIIEDIKGDFIGNYSYAGVSTATGGAIINHTSTGEAAIGNIEGDFIGNYAYSIGSSAGGGAIYNYDSGTNSTLKIGNIKGDFIGNYASSTASYAFGGAIYNRAYADASTATIGDITGDFIANYASSTAGYATGGAIYSSAQSDGGTATIAGITGDFIGNYASSTASLTGSYAYGGAIYNEAYGTGSTAAIGALTGDFIANYAASAADIAAGGALANYAYGDGCKVTIENITGDFIANYASSAASAAQGGALANMATGSNTAKIGDIVTDEGFIANAATSTGSKADGGAIYNYATGDGSTASIDNITGDFNYNYAAASGSTAAYARGGAIFNYGESGGTAEVGKLSSNFTGNYAQAVGGTAAGGAIYNFSTGEDSTSTIGDISGDLLANSATATDGNAYGGAIYNYAESDATAQIGSITGDLLANYVEATGEAKGGAIYTASSSIGAITGDLSGNYAVSSAGDAMGGAIYNENSTLTITGDVGANKATATAGDAYGGAIYNTVGSSASEIATVSTTSTSDASATTTVTGDLLANSVTAAGDAYGGAIYNDSGEVTINGNIAENSATSTSGTALGGAIYNAGTGTVNINSDNKELFITGNSTSSDSANALYAEADTTTNLNLTNSGDIFFYDNFNGETGYTVNVTGESVDNNTLYLYNDMYNANLNIGGVTIDTINNDIHTYSLNKFTLTGNTQMVADVDLKNEQMDRFSTGYLENGTENYGSNNGTLTVSGMNLVSDTSADTLAVYFAEPGLKEYVASTVGELPDGNQTDVYAPVYKYNVEYKKDYELKEDYAAEYAAAVEAGTADGMASELDIDNGGYFVFNKTGENPAVKATQVAQMGAFTGMALMYDYSFEHSDYYMKLPSEVRLAIREKAKAAKALKEAKKNGTSVEEETANIEAANAAEKASHEGVKFYERDDTFHLYKEHELTTDGLWVRPFASHESVPFAGQFTVKNNNYGALIGIDTEFKEQDNGWASVFTGYIGYNGSTQGYAGNHVRQDGGVIGVTESFYKKNYYAAITIGAGAGDIDGDTMYGNDRTHEYSYGVALKTGWNLEYDGGNYTFLPTFMASWTSVNVNDYTNAAGVKVDSDPFRAVQLKPNFKLIRNLKNGWQPYLTVGEVWTVGQTSGVRADEFTLDKLSFRPYTEYGLGVQKRWANNYDGYAQVLGHAGGRRGVLVNIGFRWEFN